MQAQLERSQQIEANAQAAVREWRSTAKFSSSRHYRVSPESIEVTQALEGKILKWILETFNSLVLMRLNFEVLVALGREEEAFAAFRTYVALTKLHALKRESGAQASTDTEAARVVAFQLAVTVMEARYAGTDLLDKARELASDLSDKFVMPHDDPEAVSRANSILGRTAYIEAQEALDSATYDKWSAIAYDHFSKVDPATSSIEANKVHIKLVNDVKGPPEAFEIAKKALAAAPDSPALTVMIVVLLSAEDQLDAALAISEHYLNTADLSIGRASDILALKKAHVALIEASSGPVAALEELPSFADTLEILFGPEALGSPSETPASSTKSGIKGEKQKPSRPHHHHANGNSTQDSHSQKPLLHLLRHGLHHHHHHHDRTTASVSKDKGHTTKSSKHVPNEWLWIAELYLRAGLYKEARDAAEQAKRLDKVDYAQVHAVQGEIEFATKEYSKAWAQFKTALTLDSSNTASAIGMAQVLVLPTSQTILDIKDNDAFTSIVHGVISVLEGVTSRKQGRHVAEAFYYLGTLYESVGDTESARASLWRSVELTESRGVLALR